MNRTLQIKSRLKIVLIALAVLHSIIVLRALYVQQVDGEWLNERLRKQTKRIITLQARRGYIFDQHGKRLAMDVPYMSVFVVPSMLKTGKERKFFAKEMSKPLKMKPAEIEAKLAEATRAKPYVWLQRFTTEEIAENVAKTIKENQFNCVAAIREQKRVYPNSTTAAQVIGFVGEGGGLEGIEMTRNSMLSGRNGYIVLQKDHLGRSIPQSIREEQPARNGYNIWLTLDQTIQHYAEDQLTRTIQEFNARGGAALVIETKTGRILAMASQPSFDPNNYKEYLKTDPTSFRNRVIWFRFEPGSIMKPLIVSTALDRKVIEPFKEMIYCQPVMMVSGHPIKDDHGVDIPNMKTPVYVIAHSSNTGAARIALMMGASGIASMINRFYFNKNYSFPLTGQQGNMLPNLNHMAQLTIADNGFGYAISVSMLHMAMATAAIANDGQLMQPLIIDKVTGARGKVLHESTPKVLNQAVSPETAKLMRYMMSRVVEEGTGKNARIPGYTVAGKTGTAKIVRDGGYRAGEYFASFVGYAPVEDPRLLVMVTIERPTPVYYAAQVAAPAFKEIMMKSLWHLDVPPSKVKQDQIAY